MSSAGFFTWEDAVIDFPIVHEDDTPAPEFVRGYRECVVTFWQGGRAVVEKRGSDVGVDEEAAVVAVRLGQDETGLFRGGTEDAPARADVQLNVINGIGDRDVTFETSIDVWRNLHPRRMGA